MSGFIRRRKLSSGRIRYYPILTINEQQKSLGGFSRRRDAEAQLKQAEGELAEGEGQWVVESILDRHMEQEARLVKVSESL